MGNRTRFFILTCLFGVTLLCSTASIQAQIPSTLGWYQISNTQMQNVCPPGFNCANVIAAWSGGIADTKRNRLLVWGGGHVDYDGNEVYALDLNTLTMNRLNNPTMPTTLGACSETNGTGNTPTSRHTYGGLTYVATMDAMWAYSGSLATSGCASGGMWLLDLPTLTWSRKDPTNGIVADGAGGIAISDYDSSSHLVYLATPDSPNTFISYDPTTNATVGLRVGHSDGVTTGTTGAVDPVRRLFIIFGNGFAGSYALADGTPQDWSAQTSGCGPLQSAVYPGFTYDSSRGLMVGWAGGNTVYEFNPDTKVCNAVTYSGGPGVAQQANGTNGRFRYFPALNVFALVNDVTQNAYALRLTNGTPPPSDTTPPSVPTGLSANAVSSSQINLFWTASTDNVGVTGYKVFRCQGLGCSPSAQIATNASTSFQDTGLTAGTTYAYSVSAYDAAGNNSALSASASAVTLPTSGGGGGVSADQDFANRCKAPGVVKCVGMDTMGTYGHADVVRMDVDPNNGNLRPRSDGQYRGTIDTAVKMSGAGSLRFQLDGGYAAANIAGQFLPNTNDGLGAGFGENSTFYVQYAVRFSPEMLSNLAFWDSNWKVSIFHMDQQSCAGKELTLVNHQGRPNNLEMYKDCGADGMDTLLDGQTWTDPNPPYLSQQGNYFCDYGNYTNCWNFPTNTWITMYYKVHFGTSEQPNSTMEAWYAVNGQPYVKWINVTQNFTIHCNGNAPCPNEVFNNLSLLTYMTGLSVSAPATAYTWYDELIVSSQPIAAPGGTPPPSDTTPPSTPTNLSASAVSSSQINLSWTASTDNVGVAGYKIFRCQGAGCTPSVQVAAPTSNSFQDTGLTASTTYTYTVSAFDAAGNNSAQSAPASSTTQAPALPDTTPPTVAITSPGNGSTVSGVITVTGTAADNVAVSNVQVSIDGGAFASVSGTTNWTFSLNTALLTNGSHTIVAKATDSSGNTTSTATLNVTVSNSISASVRINSGGPNYTDPQGHLWNTDFGFTGGTPFAVTQNINNTTTPTLYQTERYGNFAYQLNIATGVYVVTLKFSENFFTATGQRVFNTLINGQTVLSNFDIFAQAGGEFIALDKSFTVDASTTGQINLQFISVVDNAKIDAIDIEPSSSTVTDTTPPSVPTGLTAVAISSTQIVANWSASSDNVGVAGYKVFRCQGVGCTPSAQVGTTGSTSYLDNGLSPSTTYAYKISAFDAAGNVSALSASASAVTLSSSVPSNLPPVVSAIGTNATDVDPATPGLQIYDNTSVTYTGSASDPNGGMITWQWLYTTNGGSPVLMASGTGTVQPFTFNYPAGIAPKTYVWILSANNGVSTVQQTLTVNVIVRPSNPPPTPPPADAKPGLRDTLVFPNPTVNQNPTIRTFLGQVASVEITIFDASGQVVHSASLGGTPTGIANGQYYYDYVWSGIKFSGVYFAVIHGKAADGSIIRARTKFAVIR